MRIASLSTLILFAAASTSPAQAYRYNTWPSPPTIAGGGYYGGWGAYGAGAYSYPRIVGTPTVWYQPQTHWIYNYMPIGYAGYGYDAGAYGAYNYGYGQTGAVRDTGPPARSRSALYPAIPYSEFAASERQQANDRRAYFIVQVPVVEAQVWINGKLTTQTGLERSFMTPEMGDGTTAFEVKVSWTDNFGPRTQSPTIQLRAGDSRTLVFPLATK